jgi:hypothetical protein
MSKFKDREGFYHSETEVVRNQVKREQFWLSIRRATGLALRHEFGIGYNYVLERFRPVFYDPLFDTTGLGLTEQEEKLGWITFTYKIGQARFTQTSNLDRYSRIEDINLGWSIQAGLGRASTLYGSNVNRTYLEGSTRFAVELPWRQYLSLQMNSSTFATRNDFIRADHQLNLSYYNQSFPRQTLAMGIRAYDYRLYPASFLSPVPSGRDRRVEGILCQQFLGHKSHGHKSGRQILQQVAIIDLWNWSRSFCRRRLRLEFDQRNQSSQRSKVELRGGVKTGGNQGVCQPGHTAGLCQIRTFKRLFHLLWRWSGF